MLLVLTSFTFITTKSVGAITYECSIIVSLTQSIRDRRSAKNIGFRIYKVSNKDKKEPIFGPNFINNSSNVVEKTQTWIDYREVLIKL